MKTPLQRALLAISEPILGAGLALIVVGAGFALLVYRIIPSATYEWLGSVLLFTAGVLALRWISARVERGRKVGVIRSGLITGMLLSVMILPALFIWGLSALIPGSIPTKPVSTKRPPAFKSVVLAVPAEKMPAALRDAYRPGPDRRFFQAMQIIDSFLTGGGKPQPVQAQFRQTEWTVLAGGSPVGTLPEFAGFRDGLDLLSGYARTLLASHPLNLTSGTQPAEEIRTELDRFFAPYPLQALEAIDEEWNGGNRTPEHPKLAAHALTINALQLADRVEVADQVPARALAFVVLSRVATDDAILRDTCLLSHLLGYTGDAEDTAGSVPPADPVQQYVLQDRNGLLRVASSGNREVQYLYMLRLAELHSSEPLVAAMRRFESGGEAPGYGIGPDER
jgi:hypothetical protein